MKQSPDTPLSPQHQQLAADLSQIHGKLKVTSERSGTHFYICCPACLDEIGEDEICKRDLAINADKVLRAIHRASLCMRCGTVFSVKDLLKMKPLEERGYERVPGGILTTPAMVADLYEADDDGNQVPKGPGETIPIIALPGDHPAIWYLRSRSFDPVALYRQFGAEYCARERADMKYTRIGHGFKLSPQGRIIFNIIQHGVRVGWQARLIEGVDDRYRYLWNGHKDQWIAVQQRATLNDEWTPLEGWENFDPPRYITGWGTRRNACLAGFDAAVEFNRSHSIHKPFCVLVEGVLDAARFGPPAIATLGKYCSENQATLIKSAFQLAVVAPDNDKAGRSLVHSARQWLGPRFNLTVAHLPSGFKDAGEMDERSAKAFLCGALGQAFNLPPAGRSPS